MRLITNLRTLLKGKTKPEFHPRFGTSKAQENTTLVSLDSVSPLPYKAKVAELNELRAKCHEVFVAVKRREVSGDSNAQLDLLLPSN